MHTTDENETVRYHEGVVHTAQLVSSLRLLFGSLAPSGRWSAGSPIDSDYENDVDVAFGNLVAALDAAGEALLGRPPARVHTAPVDPWTDVGRLTVGSDPKEWVRRMTPFVGHWDDANHGDVPVRAPEWLVDDVRAAFELLGYDGLWEAVPGLDD